MQGQGERKKDPRHVPTREEIRHAVDRTVPDIIAPGLDVLFCGINPGLYSAAIGCHFGHPGNRFWKALWQSGFTDRRLSPYEQEELLAFGCGVTNLVTRATARAAELSADELRAGRAALERKIRKLRPKSVAVLGIGAYRTGFSQAKASVGPQSAKLAGASLWVLPNPSGLNGAYPLPILVPLFRNLFEAVHRVPSEAWPACKHP
ncbi:G/U mismatch-specific DNA glycosylase [Candidatus Bipolaricaulota bacterium]|nr:G/U mismatch-specific DNA glycosylase [Candidatus Bipolaricaulota bacterium]